MDDPELECTSGYGCDGNRACNPLKAWGISQLIETENAGHADDPEVATDGDGNGFVVWQQHDGTRNNVWANRYLRGVGWGVAVLLETSDSDAYKPRVAADSQGNAMVVWTQNAGANGSVWSNRYIAGFGWGSAMLVETYDAGGAGGPRVDLDRSGNGVAVWHEWHGMGWQIWANRFVVGAGWQTAERLDDSSDGALNNADVSVNADGAAIAVWAQVRTDDSDVYASHYSASTGWTDPIRIDNEDGGADSSPVVALADNGRAVAGWNRYRNTEPGQPKDAFASSFSPGGGWGTPALLETKDEDAFIAQVAVASDGGGIAIWSHSPDPDNAAWVSVFDQASGWTSAAPLLTGMRSATFGIGVAIDGMDNAVTVCSDVGVVARRYSRGIWETPTTIDDRVGSGAADIAAAPDGSAIAVWRQYDGTRFNIWANVLD